MEERVDEVEAEKHSNTQANNGFIHGAVLSQALAGVRIGADDNEEHDSQTNINEIGHDEPFCTFRTLF